MNVLTKQPENIEKINITILGSSSCGVGKTCIIKRYIKDEFILYTNATNSSALEQKTIIKRGKRFSLNIWDTVCRDKTRSINRHFYKNANIIIFVYDISIKISFEEIKNIYYNDVRKFGEKYKVLAIVGNKIDLKEEEEVDEEMAREFAKEINACFMLVSAKENININELFNTVVDAYLGAEFKESQKKETFEQVEESEAETKKLRNNYKIVKKKKNLLY